MLTGFLILGTTVSAWRRGLDRRVRYALAGATLLLPSQIILGALTVTQYEILILTAHFVTASIIFAATAAAAAWVVAPVDVAAIRRAVGGAGLALAGLAALSLALSPRLLGQFPTLAYTPAIQFVYYGLGLAAFGALVAGTLWVGDLAARTRRGDRTAAPSWLAVRTATVAGAAVLLALLVFGRLVNVAGPVPIVGSLAGVCAAVAAAYLLRDAEVPDATDGHVSVGD
jgi:cytochrome c oxidase assembly protein subunit 15